jgi:arsenite-transporting ATPase
MKKEFLLYKPGIRYYFFGGKGGVGKTTLAAATALWHAREKTTLLASTNPVHSLASLLETKLNPDRPTEVTKNLFVYEITTEKKQLLMKEDLNRKLKEVLRYSDLGEVDPSDFLEVAGYNPAFEQAAMFESMIDLIIEDKYDIYVFDTAPAANARRLLGMSKVYSLWVDKLLASRKEATYLAKLLSWRKKKEKEDTLLQHLIKLRERIDLACSLLTSKEKTIFYFILLPEALPIAVVKRFYSWFSEFGIPTGGVIINGVIQIFTDNEFIKEKIKSQQGYIEYIYNNFSPIVAWIPLLEKEVKGLEMLEKIIEYLSLQPSTINNQPRI